GDAAPGPLPAHGPGPGPGAMLPLLLLLLRMAPSDAHVGYMPELTQRPLAARVTTSTFVLEQPRCIFTNTSSDLMIWLVVALDEATGQFDPRTQPETPPLAFQTFPNNTAYATLGTSVANYPCPAPTSRDITVLRVGSETACRLNASRPSCNGPLPGPGPYRVKFVAWKSSQLEAETEWSEPITLLRAHMVPVTPSGRSAGMIVLTSILSILFAVLLACLVALLVTCSSVFSTKADAVSVRRYNTHHVYDQPAARL
uniref:Uroplakin 3B n=1 Tax=Nothoprocta perdicaria TaxID=30464 RepID=A0A8C6YPC2_NOTPE